MRIGAKAITFGLLAAALIVFLPACKGAAPAAAPIANAESEQSAAAVQLTPTPILPEPTFVPGSVVMTLDPASAQAKPGEEFIVSVQIQSGSQLVDTAQASLNFDPAVLSVVEVQPGPALPTLLQNSSDNQAGTIDFSAGALPPAQPASGTFVLAQIKFRALAPVPSTSLVFQSKMPRQSGAFSEGMPVLALNGAQNGTIILTSE